MGGRYYDARDFIMLFLAFLVSSAVAEDVANVTDCLKLFGDAVVSCGSFMSAPAGNYDDCVKDVVSILGLTSGRSGLFEGTACICYPAIRSMIPTFLYETVATYVNCEDWSTYEYGCEDSDQMIDLERFKQIGTLSDTTRVDRDSVPEFVRGVFDEHASIEFLGGGIYHGIDMVTEYSMVTIPQISRGIWVWGPALEFLHVSSDKDGHKVSSLSELLFLTATDVEGIPADERWRYYKRNPHFGMVSARWADFKYLPCSNKVSKLTMGLDQTSVDTFFQLQAVLPNYNEEKYCKVLMEECQGENAQFASLAECLEFNRDDVPIQDDECMASGLMGMGHSKYCRVLHVHMIPLPGAKAHCFHTGLGGTDPKGGAHCFAGECGATASHFSPETLTTHAQWVEKFNGFGSHECINGIWDESFYLFRWVKPRPKDILSTRGNLDVGFTCCVLGEFSYFKLFDADESGTHAFEMNDAGSFAQGEIRLSESAQQGWNKIEVIQNTKDGTTTILELSVGLSECASLLTTELCVSLPAAGVADVFFKVNGKKAATLKLKDEMNFDAFDWTGSDLPELEVTNVAPNALLLLALVAVLDR